MLTYTLLAGLLFGWYFTLIGIGLNLVFGVMRIVNLAHGDFLMLGGFLAVLCFTLYSIDPVLTLPIAFTLFFLLGIPVYFLLVPRLLMARDPEMLSFILFFGFSQVLEAAATIAFGSSERSIPGAELGRIFAELISVVVGRAVESGPIELFDQSAWRVRSAARLCDRALRARCESAGGDLFAQFVIWHGA